VSGWGSASPLVAGNFFCRHLLRKSVASNSRQPVTIHKSPSTVPIRLIFSRVTWRAKFIKDRERTAVLFCRRTERNWGPSVALQLPAASESKRPFSLTLQKGWVLGDLFFLWQRLHSPHLFQAVKWQQVKWSISDSSDLSHFWQPFKLFFLFLKYYFSAFFHFIRNYLQYNKKETVIVLFTCFLVGEMT
jgi:hypothetical protein